ncbi:MAG: methyltransferase domain-containing protein [Candidatus Competibacteraceae bacterium]|nr:methyltransferase domain-containing protein [Candidatus Competibacteraceae bacterium]
MTQDSSGVQNSGAQTWSAERYARNARFVAELGSPVVELLAPRPGERILDLGCGDGALTVQLERAGASVVGVDSAPDLISAAQSLGLDARLMDAHALSFEHEFDAVFSNAALHWMLQPDAVLAGVKRALKPGGRFVAEFGGHGNVAAIVVALLAVLARRGIDGVPLMPWYFPSDQDYRQKLEQHGFTVQDIQLIPRPTPLPTDMAGWLDTFTESFFRPLSEQDRAAAQAEALALLRPVLCDSQGRWTADYMRLRFAAVVAE